MDNILFIYAFIALFSDDRGIRAACKKKLNGRKISLRENESASLGTPDTRADSLLVFGREEGHPTV